MEIGKAEVVHDGTDVVLFGLGGLFDMAVETRDILAAMGYSVALINPRWIKPLDTEVIDRYAQRCSAICTFEDHVLSNGFGAAIIEHLNDAGILTKVERIGWPDAFIDHGGVPSLRHSHGLSAQHAVSKLLPHLPRRVAPAEVA